jgi:hypothetical protein
MSTCVVCGGSNPKFALPLTKENGKWVVKDPICAKCRGGLLSEAYAQGKSIRIFSLAGSLKEAEERNANTLKFTPFLNAFARAERRPVAPGGNGDKRKLEVKA